MGDIRGFTQGWQGGGGLDTASYNASIEAELGRLAAFVYVRITESGMSEEVI